MDLASDQLMKRFDRPEGPLFYAEAGQADAPVLLCLHGFPESWLAFEAVMPLLAERFRVLAPDQRGYARSFKPEGVEAYQTRHLAADMLALIDNVSPDRPVHLLGHDWGSATAYSIAFRKPERIATLTIANGVHPWCFQNAILNDPDQRAASQYMNRLKAADAEVLLSANGYSKLMRMMEGFSGTPWLSDALKAQYVAQWSEPGALTGMLNWYRASPVVVPEVGAPVPDAAVMSVPLELMKVRMPHLVIWGEADTALRPTCIAGLERFAPDLTIRKVAGAGHWILHEKPQETASAMFTQLIHR